MQQMDDLSAGMVDINVTVITNEIFQKDGALQVLNLQVSKGS